MRKTDVDNVNNNEMHKFETNGEGFDEESLYLLLRPKSQSVTKKLVKYLINAKSETEVTT